MSARWALTFLQSLVDEFLHLQSLLVSRLILKKGSDILQRSLILLRKEQNRTEELKEKKKKELSNFCTFQNVSAALGIRSYFESVVGHCKVEQEVSGIIFGCSLNKL